PVHPGGDDDDLDPALDPGRRVAALAAGRAGHGQPRRVPSLAQSGRRRQRQPRPRPDADHSAGQPAAPPRRTNRLPPRRRHLVHPRRPGRTRRLPAPRPSPQRAPHLVLRGRNTTRPWARRPAPHRNPRPHRCAAAPVGGQPSRRPLVQPPWLRPPAPRAPRHPHDPPRNQNRNGPMNQIRRVWCRTRAKNWTRPNAAVILDTETTDLDGEIIEIAIIDAATGHTRLNTLVDPGTPIAPEATAVHGITDEMVHGAPRWPQLWPRLAPLLHKGTVLAWNAPFDRGRIHHECVRHGIPTPRARWRCLMRLA